MNSEWIVNQQRDSYTTYIGHEHMLAYFAVAQDLPIARLRYRYLEQLVDPCGPPPPPAREAFLPKDVVEKLHQRDELPPL